MGLLDIFMPYKPATTGYGPNRPEQNGFTNWFNQNPYALQGLGAGLSSIGAGLVGHGSDTAGMLTGVNQALAAQQGPIGQMALMQRQYNQQQQDVAKQQQQQNQTIKMLRAKGRADLADAIEAGAITAQKGYEMFLTPQKADNAQYGLSAVWGTDKNGNPVMGQLSNAGGIQMVQPPDGVTFGKDPIKIDAGDRFILLDPVTRQPIGEIPIDNRAAARDTAIGKAEGEATGSAITSAPRANLQMQQANAVADKILNNSAGLDEVFGNIWGIPQQMTPALPGTKKADAINDINELINKSWLTVRADLKGAGQITDYESQKAEAAVSQMGAALKSGSKGAFIQAVQAYKQAVAAGYALIAQQAAQGGVTAPLPYAGSTTDGADLSGVSDADLLNALGQ